MNILTTIKTGLTIAKDWSVQHSPEILLGTSIASGIGATVTGCIATKKMEKINARHKELLAEIHEAFDNSAEDNPEFKRQIVKEYGRYWFQVGKTWAPCVCFTAVSVTSAYGSFRIINGRLIKAEMALAGLTQFIERYRENVIEDAGEEKDLYYANNGALDKKAKLIKEGKYKPKEHKSVEIVDTQDGLGVFHYIFSEDTVKWGYWNASPSYNYRMLLSQQSIFDNKLKDDGEVDLIDVYKSLGLDPSVLYEEAAQGRRYGWALDKYTENGTYNDQHVLFGILEYNDSQHKLFRLGQTPDVMLHFNCRLLTRDTYNLLADGVSDDILRGA